LRLNCRRPVGTRRIPARALRLSSQARPSRRWSTARAQREGGRVVLKRLGKRQHLCEGLRREPGAPWIPGGESSDFITPGPKPALKFGYPPSIAELQWDGWRIRLSAVEHSTDVFKNLEETGGYAFTHMGRLDRTDGLHFSARGAEGNPLGRTYRRRNCLGTLGLSRRRSLEGPRQLVR
jgi:hypothetical protein